MIHEIIRVFPRRTDWTPKDAFAFCGPPPFEGFRPEDRKIPVHVSVTFTWDKARGEELARAWAAHYDDVQIGGVAYRSYAGEFTPGMYLKEGCTITSRGCPIRRYRPTDALPHPEADVRTVNCGSFHHSLLHPG